MTSLILFILKENKRRILSWVCFICMLFNTIPVASFASEFEGDLTEPVEVVQDVMPDDNDPVVPAAQEPADPVDSQNPSDPPADTENGEAPVVVDQDNPQDAPAAEEADIIPDNSADITPDEDALEPDTNDIVPEGQDVPSSEEVVLPSLFIDFPATGVFSVDTLSVSYKYTSAKNEELVISLDNIAAEIEVKYMSDEMPVETVRTEDEETGYAYYRLSALKDEVYLIRVFVEKADEEIPYSITITEYVEPSADVEPEVQDIEPDNTGDALIDIPPEATNDKPEASNDTEPDTGMVDIFPDLPNNEDTSAFENFLNDNTEPADETPGEENQQDLADDITPVEPVNDEDPDDNNVVEPEGQVSEDTEEPVGEEPDVEPEDNNNEEEIYNDAQDTENPASDAILPDIIPDADNEPSDAFDGFLTDNTNDNNEPEEDATSGEPQDEEPADAVSSDELPNDDYQDEGEKPEDFLVVDDEEDEEDASEVVADEKADDTSENNDELNESEPDEPKAEDLACNEVEEKADDEAASNDEQPAEDTADEEEQKEEETASEDEATDEEAEDAEEEEDLDVDEETFFYENGVYTYTGHGLTVSVETSEENGLPEGTEFVLTPVSVDEERVAEYVAQAADLNGVEPSSIIPYVFDMHFEYEGEEVAIAEGSTVHVNIHFDSALELGDVIAAPFYHIEGGKLVTLIQDVTQKEEVMPMRGAKGMMKSAPAKAEEKSDEDKSEEEEPKEENKTVESIDFTVGSFSDFMLTGVKGGSRAVDKYYIFYSNGDLVIQDGNTTDPDKGTVVEMNLITNGELPQSTLYSLRYDLQNIYINTQIVIACGAGTYDRYFYGLSNLKNIYGIDNVDLTNETSLMFAFGECQQLQHIYGLDAWNTSTIKSIDRIFFNCQKLENIQDIEGWNLTITVEAGLYCSFYDCDKLTQLDLSGWDLSKVRNVTDMFKCTALNVSKLTSVNLGNIFTNANGIITMNCMFMNCTSLETISDIFVNIPRTQPVNMCSTFDCCYKLESPSTIDLSGIYITNFTSTFRYAKKIKSIDLSNCTIGDGIAAIQTFSRCDELETIDFTGFTAVSPSSSLADTFSYTPSLHSLDLSSSFFDSGNKDSTFLLESGIEEITLGSGFNFQNASLPNGVWERDSTGEQYTALQLKNAWDSTMADTYRLVDHTDYDHIYIILYNNWDLVFQHNDIIDETKGGVRDSWWYNDDPLAPITFGNYGGWRVTTYRENVKNIYINTPIKFQAASTVVGSDVFFSDFINCEYIYGINNIDLSSEGTLAYAFHDCKKLKHIYGLDEWDTHTITSIDNCFYYCCKLDNIQDIEGWNLTITNGSGLRECFHQCQNLISLDLSSWDLSNCYSLSGTFRQNINLQSVNLGNVFSSASSRYGIELVYTFENCEKLTYINDIFSNIPLAEEVSISYMLNDAYLFAMDVDLSGHIIKDMTEAFYSCYNIPSIDMSDCTFGGATSGTFPCERTFKNCRSLTTLDLTNVTCHKNWYRPVDMFYNTQSLQYLDLANIYMADNDYTKTSSFFEGSGITRITLNSNFQFQNAVLPYGVWERESTGEQYGAVELKTIWDSTMADTYVLVDPIDYENKYVILYSNGDLVFQHGNVLDPARGSVIFSTACPNDTVPLNGNIPWSNEKAQIKNVYFNTSIKIPFDTGNGDFNGCTSLEYIYNIENWDTSNRTTLIYCFQNCTKLKHIYGLDEWDNQTITDIRYIFSHCNVLDNITDIESWNLTISGMGLKYAFSYCGNLTTLDLSGWDLSKVREIDLLFNSATALQSVNLGNIFTNANPNPGSAYDIRFVSAFTACTSLVSTGNLFANIPYDASLMMTSAFQSCTALSENIDLSGHKITSLENAFSGCSSIKYIDLSDCTLSGSARYAFNNCKKLRKLDLSNISAPASATGLDSAFYNTSILAYLDLSSSYFNAGSKNANTFNGSGISKVTLGSGFQFNSSTLPAGNWKRESTGEIYTAAQLKSAWNSSMADTYEKVNVVQFDANGGSVYPTRLVKHLNETFDVEDFPVATRDGYTFVGWFSDETAGHEVSAGDTIDQDIYFARWTENAYTLVLKKNDSGDPNDTEIRVPLSYTDIYQLTPNLFTVDNKVLQKWSTNPDGTGTIYGPDERIGMLTTINGNEVILYANWGRAQTVTVTFDSQGGSPVNTLVIEKYTDLLSSQFTVPSKEGYAFGGWWTDPVDGERWDTSDHQMTDSVQLYAHWTSDPIVTFIPNGGYISKLSKSVPYGGTLADLPWGSDASKTLVGFFTSPTFGEGNRLTTSTVITEDVTYYAQWGYQPYFNLAGGHYSGNYSIDTAYPVSESNLIEITSFPPVERDGYTLVGWMLPDETPVNIGDIIDRELHPEIIAVWDRTDTVTVTFDPNGGKFAQYAETNSTTLCKQYEMFKGDALGYYPDAYKETSYNRLELLGWFDENDVLYTRDTIINEDVTLYAKWQDTTTVSYIFIVYDSQYRATSMYDNNYNTMTGGTKNTVHRTKGEEFGILPGLSIVSGTGATLNGKYLEGWYSSPEPFNLDGTLKDGVEKLLPTTAKTTNTTWYANIVNNVVDKYDDQTAYKYYAEWTNASNNDVSNSDNNLNFHPQNKNNQTASLHMHFELNAEVTETLPIGSVRITFPKSVWKDWDGNDVGTTNLSAQLPMYPQIQSGMFFSYAEDGNGNYVILNNQEISGGAGVDLTIAYTVNPALVPGGAIDRDKDYVEGYPYYQGNVPVVFEIDRDVVTTYNTVNDVPVLTDSFAADVQESKTLTIEMHTRVDISIKKEYIGTSYNWSDTWGPEPDDANDYFYITWKASSDYTFNQPFTQFITEDTVHDGTVVYNSFEKYNPNGLYHNGVQSETSSQKYTIVTRHPKSLLDNIPATGVTLRNQVRHTAQWKSGYVTDYVADAEHTIYNWYYPVGEFDKTNVYGGISTSGISPFGTIDTHAQNSPRYVKYTSAQNKIMANRALTFEWELTYDGWSSGTPILWDDETRTYSRQQRVIALSDGNNNDIMYSSGAVSARYVWEPATGNVPLSDYEYTITRLRVYLREYDGEYRNGEWGGPVLRDDYSMWNPVSIYVRYRNTDELVYYTSVKLLSSGHSATTNGWAESTVTLPDNVVGWEVRYPTSYFKTYLQVNEAVVINPSVDLKTYVASDIRNNATSIIKNRGYCDIWTSDDVYADAQNIFFHATDWTGGFNGANKEIYELTYQAGALHTNKSASSQGNVIFDVQRGIQENPMAIYGRNYFSGTMQPITSGKFYDLLPRGATVDPASIYGVLSVDNASSYRTTNYANSYTTSPSTLSGYLPKEYYNVEFVENWQNSGRTMMIIDYRTPDNTTNMATFYYLLRMTYQDVISYGTSVQNDVAFMDTSGTNRYDHSSSSSLKNAISVLGDDATYYEDINVMEDAVVFAKAPTNYIPVDAYSWGFFKSVNTRNSYSQQDITIPNNIYTYKLNYAQSDNAEVTDMVFFDVLERGAYDNAFNGGTLERASEWEGEFDSIDITPLTALLKKGSTASNKVYCAPVVYYSTKAKDQFTGADWDVSNTATWTTTMPAKNLITAVAVDCRTSSDGTPFIMQGRNNAMFYIRMRSSSDPADVGKIAVNQGMFQAVVNNEPNQATSDTSVTLTEEEPEIHKTSDPVTGTAEAPTLVVTGEALTYTLSVTNTNTQFTVPNIVVSDPIPSTLLIDTQNIIVHFGDTNNAMTVAASPRANMRVAGNNLVFTIKSLEPEEVCYFIIPCSVKNEANTVIENTATITSVNDVAKDIDSETTYHKISYRIPFSKLSSSGDFAVGATLQLWDTDKDPDELIEQWISTNEVKYILLCPGHYLLTETVTPDGYLTADDIEFEIQADGTILFDDSSTDNKVIMVDEAIIPIKGTKIWKYDDPTNRPASITVRLMRMVEGDGSPVATGDSINISEQDDWAFDFGYKPQYDANGNEYIYSVAEDAVTGYSVQYLSLSNDTAPNGLQITFNALTSTYDSADTFTLYYVLNGKTFGQTYYGTSGTPTNPAGTTIQIPATEFWIAFESDGSNNDYGFKLDQIIPVQIADVSPALTRMEPPTWVSSVTVEEYTGGRYPETEHNYYIYDKILMHYSRSMDGGSYDIINIKETPQYNIPINKINEDDEKIGGVSLRLTSVPEPGDPEIQPIDWVTVEGQSYTVQLYPGHYLLHEVAPAAGYLIAEDIRFEVNGEGKVIIDETELASVDMLDKDINQPYPFRKVWLDNGLEAYRPSSVTFNLIRVSDGQVVATKTLTSSDAEDAHTWVGAFDPVPMVDNNMEPIEYAVREVVTNDDYTVYHDVQNKVGFHITFTEDSDLGSNGILYIFPLGYPQENMPAFCQGKATLVLNPSLNMNYAEGTDIAGSTYFVPIIDGVEGFVIFKSLKDYSQPDDIVNIEIESITPALQMEPYSLSGNGGPTPVNIFTGSTYPNLNTSDTTFTYMWYSQPDTLENINNTKHLDEIVNEVNKINVPFSKHWDNENGDTTDRPANITFNLYNVLDMTTVVDTMTVPSGTAITADYQFENVPKYNQDSTLAKYVVREATVAGYQTFYSPEEIRGFLITFSNNTTAGEGYVQLYAKDTTSKNGPPVYVRDVYGSYVTSLYADEMAGNTYYVPVKDVDHPGFILDVCNDTSNTAVVDIVSVVPVEYTKSVTTFASGSPLQYVINQFFENNNYPYIHLDSSSFGNRSVAYDYTSVLAKNVYNIKNETSIPVTKIWDDTTDEYRPASITISAYNVNDLTTPVGSITLTSGNADTNDHWVGTITGLPKYNPDGTEAQYVVKETPVTGYVIAGNKPTGLLVTFSEDSYLGEQGNIGFVDLYSVSNENHTSVRHVGPSLYGEDISGQTFFIPVEENGCYSFLLYNDPVTNNVIKIENVRLAYTTPTFGFYYTNTVDTTSVDYSYSGTGPVDLTGHTGYILYNYNSAITNEHSFTGSLTNTYNITSVPFMKYWDEENGDTTDRPANITFKLYDSTDLETVVSSLTVPAGTAASTEYHFDNVPKYYQDGTEIKYIVSEDAVPGYFTTISNNIRGLLITFTNDSTAGTGTMDILPRNGDSLTSSNAITLSGNRMAGQTYYLPVMNSDNPGFVIVLTDQAKNSHIQVQSVVPVDYYRGGKNTPSWYSIVGTYFNDTNVIYSEGNNYPNITLTQSSSDDSPVMLAYNYSSFEPEIHNIKDEVDVPVTKVWQNDTAADRPASITINAYNVNTPTVVAGSITLTSSDADGENQWTGTISGLPKFNSDGTEAHYVLKEAPVTGYFTKYEKPTGLLVTFTEDSYLAPAGAYIGFGTFSTRSNYQSYAVSYTDNNYTEVLSNSSEIAGKTYYIPILDDDNYAFTMRLSGSGLSNSVIKIESVLLTNTPQPYHIVANPINVSPTASNTAYGVPVWYHGTGGYDLSQVSAATIFVYDYTGLIGSVNNGAASLDGIIINDKDIINIPFVKDWDDTGFANERPDTLTFTLYNTRDDQTPVSTVTLTRSEVENQDTWNGVFTNVPKYNEDGTLATYNIREETLDYYTSTNYMRGIKGYLIKFGEDTDLTGAQLRIYQSDGVTYNNYVSPSPASSISVPYYWDSVTDTLAGKTVYVPLLSNNYQGFTIFLDGNYNSTAHYTIDYITPVYEELNAAIQITHNTGTVIMEGSTNYDTRHEIVEDATSYSISIGQDSIQDYYTHFKWNYNTSANHGVNNVRNKYYVQFNKNSEMYDHLMGATLQILKKSDNTVIDEWETNAYDHQSELAAGEYILHEVSAPAGFAVAADIEFVVEADGAIKVDGRQVDMIWMTDRETIDVVGEKSWVGDNASQRPASITVNLYREGNLIDSQTVTSADDWKYSFEGLDRYNEYGIPWVYTVDESPVYDYSETDLPTSLTESWHDDVDELPLPVTSTAHHEHIETTEDVTVYGYEINLSSNSQTQSYTYDSFYVYFRMNGSLYRISSGQGSNNGRFGGSLSSKKIKVPSNDIYIVWRTNASTTYWGWQITDMVPLTSPLSGVYYSSQSALPTTDAGYSYGTPIEYTGTNYPQTTHYYSNNERKIYHWTGPATVTRDVVYDNYELSTDNGLLVTFDNDSGTHSSSDNLLFLCCVNGEWYPVTTNLSGNLGGTQVIIPSREFVILWNSDTSYNGRGWKIASITDYGSVTIPVTAPGEYVIGSIDTANEDHRLFIGDNYPENTWYSDNELTFFHYFAEDATTVTLPDEEDRYGAYVTANISNTRLPDKQNYSVYKQNPDNELIAGAVLEITGREDNTTYDIVPIRWTSSASGPQVVQLRAGQYVLHEVTPPTGYLHAIDIPFFVTSTGELVVGTDTVEALHMTDTPNSLSIPVSKTWDDTGFSQYRPASVTFDLYDTAYPETVVDTITITAANGWAGSFTDVPYVYADTEEPIEYTVVERDVSYYDEEILTDTTVLDAGVSVIDSSAYSYVYSPNPVLNINFSSISYPSGPVTVVWKDRVTGKWYSSGASAYSNSVLSLSATEAYLMYRSYSSNSVGMDIDSVTCGTSADHTQGGGAEWSDEDIDDVLANLLANSDYFPSDLTSEDFDEGSNGYHDSCVGKDISTNNVYQFVHVVRPTPSQIVSTVPSVNEIAAAEGFQISFGSDQGSYIGNNFIIWKTDQGTYSLSGFPRETFTIQSKEFYFFYVESESAHSGSSSAIYGTGPRISSVTPVYSGPWTVTSDLSFDTIEEALEYADPDNYFSGYTVVDCRKGTPIIDTRNATAYAFDYLSELPWHSYNDYYAEHGEFVASPVVAKNTFAAPPSYNIPFEKVNSSGTRIAGAHLELYNATPTKISEWDSSASAAHTESLEPGTYTLKETTVPNCYLQASDLTFTIDIDGTIRVNSVAVQSVSMTDASQPTVAVDKVDYSHQTTSLSGAVLNLYNSSNTLLLTWTSSGTSQDITSYVRPGQNYRIHESHSPNGYNIMSEDIYIQIANDGTVTMTTTEWASLTGSAANGFVLKLYNNAGVVFPATGASDRTWVYLGAVLIMVATAALFIKRKRRQKA